MFESLRLRSGHPTLLWANVIMLIGSVVAMFAYPEHPTVAQLARLVGIFSFVALAVIYAQGRKADDLSIKGQ